MGRLHTILLLLLLSSCVEIIDFGVPRQGGQLVVDGRITDGPGPYELRLSRTADIERLSIPENGATIMITDDLGRTETYEERGDGQYILLGHTVSGEVGRTYFLQINTADGRRYETQRETIPPLPAQQQDLYFDFELIEELNAFGNIISFPVVNAYVDVEISPESGQELFLHWSVEEVYLLSPTDFPDPFGAIPPPCYVHDLPAFNNHQLLQVRPGQRQAITGLKVASQILDHRFDEKHYFNVTLLSSSEAAFNYWDKIQQTVNNVGTIFDTPPAPIPGNVFNPDDPEEEVLGYFEAVSTDIIRRFLVRGDTPLNTRMDCPYRPFQNQYPERCLNCLSVRNSTYERPDYF